MPGYEGSNMQCTPPQPPPSAANERATEWYRAKDLLVQREREESMASKLLDEAREVEAAAWRALTEAADRGPQAPTGGLIPKATIGGYGPGRL
jgi:hypothetical protein